MKLFSKCSALATAAIAVFALVACDDSSSASDSYDCSVKNGVKIFYPEGGEIFKMGDTITVVYGTDVQGSGYRFVFKKYEDDEGLDFFDESKGPQEPNGKTCFEQKVVFTDDVAEHSKNALIRVIPYEKTKLGANSGSFKLNEKK